jgi:hypothetical protein
MYTHICSTFIIMELGTIMKYILITVLILAGYYVVASASRIRSEEFSFGIRRRREGFSLGSSDSSDSSSSSSSDSPGVSAGKHSSVLADKAKNINNSLQLSDNTNRTNFETTLAVMDAWTQMKIIASLNALSEQMIADSNNPSSPPSDKTLALMNSLITMTNFQTTAVSSAYKYLDGAN